MFVVLNIPSHSHHYNTTELVNSSSIIRCNISQTSYISEIEGHGFQTIVVDLFELGYFQWEQKTLVIIISEIDYQECSSLVKKNWLKVKSFFSMSGIFQQGYSSYFIPLYNAMYIDSFSQDKN